MRRERTFLETVANASVRAQAYSAPTLELTNLVWLAGLLLGKWAHYHARDPLDCQTHRNSSKNMLEKSYCSTGQHYGVRPHSFWGCFCEPAMNGSPLRNNPIG